MDWKTFFGVLFGGLITVLTAVIVERWRKPKIRIEVAQAIDMSYPAAPAQKARFVVVRVRNIALPRVCRWMLRNAAERCVATISFHHLDGQKVFSDNMNARWSSSPEPLNHIAYLFWSVFRVEIYPGEKEILNVAAKFDQDLDCFGWCDENYHSTPQWRNPKWQLPPCRYLVQVTVRSAGETEKRIFRLVNDIPGLQEFRLIDDLPGDRVYP